MIRIGFFSDRGYHDVVLRPVAEQLQGPVTSLVSTDREEIVGFRPDILVAAGFYLLEWFRAALPGCLIVNVRHGLVSKRGIKRLPDRGSARRFDIVCIGDRMTAERYTQQGAAPTEFWHTGYPQLDPLFRRDPPIDLGLDPAQPVILYAPTWNRFLSSAPMLGEQVVALIRGSGPPLNVVIKPHPTTSDWHPDWLRWWARVADGDRRVRLIEPTSDVTAVMLAADLLISDASSTIFEFMALDRPIVLLTNPAASRDNDYDADDILWRWRDVGAEVSDVNELATTVATELAAPAGRAAQRSRYADELFGTLRDGANARRVAERLVELAGRIEAGTAPTPVAVVESSVPVPKRDRLRSKSRRLARLARHAGRLRRGPSASAR